MKLEKRNRPQSSKTVLNHETWKMGGMCAYSGLAEVLVRKERRRKNLLHLLFTQKTLKTKFGEGWQ